MAGSRAPGLSAVDSISPCRNERRNRIASFVLGSFAGVEAGPSLDAWVNHGIKGLCLLMSRAGSQVSNPMKASYELSLCKQSSVHWVRATDRSYSSSRK
jgi:hypothetical protein